MRTDAKEMLAVGIFGAGSRLGGRVETLLRRGRTFTGHSSASTVVASAAALGGLLIAGAFMPRWIAFAQDSHPAFEVASIKPSKCDGKPLPGALSPNRLSLPCLVVRILIDQAYAKHWGVGNLMRAHVLGGPAWIDTDTYDIEAKASRAYPQSEKNGPMMQRLLEDRFRLRVHRETRIVPLYELTVAKGGPRLKATKPGSCTVVDPDKPGTEVPERLCGRRWETNGGTEMLDATMADLSDFLSMRMDRNVIDKTGIARRFDLVLTFQPAPDAAPHEPPQFAGMFGMLNAMARDQQRLYEGMVAPAVEQQLGLKLLSAKGPEEFIVIDHIERPSEN